MKKIKYGIASVLLAVTALMLVDLDPTEAGAQVPTGVNSQITD